MKLRVFSLLTILLTLPFLSVHAQFRVLETEYLRLIYFGRTHDYLIHHAARCFENALSFQKQVYDYKPSDKVTVFLHDFSDFGNAGAATAPENRLAIAIAPYSYTYETNPANERINFTMNHELVHISTMDQAAGSDIFFRRLFLGKVNPTSDQPLSMVYGYLTNPRRSSPRWYREGIAVYLETWMAGGLGRAMGSYDEMVFRSLAHEKVRLYDVVGLESEGTKTDFQVGANAYLYGTRFMSYLALGHGSQKLIEWTGRQKGSSGYFAAQFEKVYHLPLETAWNRWITWEQVFQQENLDRIRKYAVTPFRPLTRKPLGSVSRPWFDGKKNELYVGIDAPGKTAHLIGINTANGATREITDVSGPAIYSVCSIAYDPESDRLFYTTDNNEWRDLQSVNVETGKKKTLIKDARVGDLAFNRADRSLWGVRHFNGISTLVRIPHPYHEWNQIYSWPYGKDIYDIDVSPDGRHITAGLAEVSGRQSLIVMETDSLISGRFSYDELFDFENSVAANFVFTNDGRYLFGSSYYSGVSNIFRFDFQSGDMEAITNTETGFFRPVPVSSDSLLVFRYTSKGFVPVIIANRRVENVAAIQFLGQLVVENDSVVTDWKVDGPALVDLDSVVSYSGSYGMIREVRPVYGYPVVEGYKDAVAVGWRLSLSDPVGLHNIDVTASVSPDNSLEEKEKLHAKISYGHLNWTFSALYNGADFYDLFGPTKTSRKGYAASIRFDKNLIYDGPNSLSYGITLAGYGGLERLPRFQNVDATFERYLTLSADFEYQDTRASLGAVDHEKGYRITGFNTNNYVNRELIPRTGLGIDYGFALPVNHSSVWFRGAAGYSYGNREDPFANFYFGGFGNNRVDRLAEKRYRSPDSFPGLGINEIGGTNFSRLLLEWNLPPLRFRRVGIPSFYLTWARTSIFTTGVITNLNHGGTSARAMNLGSQIDFRLIVLSHLKMTFSVGYAVAKRKDRNQSTEFMLSLKLL